MSALIECVPNVSEGQNAEHIAQMAEVIRQTPAVKLLHIDSGFAANRTVFTFAGTPLAVFEAAFKLYKKAATLIDMQQHKGEHPRMAAVDVCPFIPVSGISIDELLPLHKDFTTHLANELNISGYWYEHSASAPERKNLAFLRKGEYEQLPEKQKTLPFDFGPTDYRKTFGATVTGIRNFLVAYNINLATADADKAKSIASKLRESSGGLKGVKSIGWYIHDFKCAQVSCNLVDLSQNGILETFLKTKTLAEELGVKVTGSELIGLAPLAEFKKVQHYLQLPENDLNWNAIIDFLGLTEVDDFSPQERVLELKLQAV